MYTILTFLINAVVLITVCMVIACTTTSHVSSVCYCCLFHKPSEPKDRWNPQIFTTLPIAWPSPVCLSRHVLLGCLHVSEIASGLLTGTALSHHGPAKRAPASNDCLSIGRGRDLQPFNF